MTKNRILILKVYPPVLTVEFYPAVLSVENFLPSGTHKFNNNNNNNNDNNNYYTYGYRWVQISPLRVPLGTFSLRVPLGTL